jgi:hypothetical protein
MGACLIGSIVAVAWAWAVHIEKKGRYPDDIDLRLSKLWNERKRKNQCIFCGAALDKSADPDRWLSESVCSTCPSFMPEPVD